MSSIPPPDPSLPGGRYQLLDEVGRGALGVVHKALDTRTGETVALKFLVDEAKDGSLMDRLLSEVALVRKLEHPAICRLHGLAAHEGQPFLVMDFLRGPTLAKYLMARGGSLGADEVVTLLRPVAEALDQAHARGVMHLDLKPANLQFDRAPEEGGVLKILDFGLARPVSAGLQRKEGLELGGTPAYRAPEQARGATPRPSADIYALGVTVYELLTGTPPFMGADLEERDHDRPPPKTPSCSGAVHRVLGRVLAYDPKARHRFATTFMRAFENAAGVGGDPTRRVSRVALLVVLVATAILLGRRIALALHLW